MGLWSRITGSEDRESFIAEVLARVRERVTDASVDTSAFAIRGGNQYIFLGNFWVEYQRATRSDRAAVIDKIAVQFDEIGNAAPPAFPTFESVRARLRPMVRDRVYRSASLIKLRAIGMTGQELPSSRPLGPGHVLSVVVDLPTSMRSVSSSERAAWGRDFDDLLAEATRNLQAVSHGTWQVARPGVLKSPYDDGYDVGRLVLPQLFRELGRRGAPVVLAVQPGVVYVTGSQDAAGLIALAELGMASLELPRRMTPTPLTLEGDRWVEHQLPASHPAKAAFDTLRYHDLVESYAAQQAQLEALPDADQGPYIATYLAMQQPDRRQIVARATFTISVPTSLPLVDAVDIMHLGELLEVPWSAFRDIVELEREPDVEPPRFRARGELSDAQIAALKRARPSPP